MIFMGPMIIHGLMRTIFKRIMFLNQKDQAGHLSMLLLLIHRSRTCSDMHNKLSQPYVYLHTWGIW